MVQYIIFWLVLTVAFVIAEIASVGLTSIWFAAGALVSLIIAILGGPLWLQIGLFLIVSVILLVATRPLAKKYLNSIASKTNADSIVGQKIIVTETINNLDQTGKTVVNGLEWTVRAEDDREVIPQGEMAQVIRISGVKLIVKGIKEEKTC